MLFTTFTETEPIYLFVSIWYLNYIYEKQRKNYFSVVIYLAANYGNDQW